MRSNRHLSAVSLVFVAALFVVGRTSLLAQASDEQELRLAAEEIHLDGNAGLTITGLPGAGYATAEEPSKYVLGVVLEPVVPALRVHLGIEEGVGMVVKHVVEGKPAEQAGIEKYDVILRCEGKSIASTKDVGAVLEEKDGKEVTIEIVREGKKKEIKIQPVPRQEPGRFELRADKIELRGEPYKLRVVQPGMVVKRTLPNLPDGMTVVITKKGSDPAKIVIEGKTKRWEATEDHLDKLPESVRKHVEPLLGRRRHSMSELYRYYSAGEGDPVKVEKKYNRVELTDQPYRVQVEVNENGAKARTIQVVPPRVKSTAEKLQKTPPKSVLQYQWQQLEKTKNKDTAAMRGELDALRKKLDERFEGLERQMQSLQKAIEELGKVSN